MLICGLPQSIGHQKQAQRPHLRIIGTPPSDDSGKERDQAKAEPNRSEQIKPQAADRLGHDRKVKLQRSATRQYRHRIAREGLANEPETFDRRVRADVNEIAGPEPCHVGCMPGIDRTNDEMKRNRRCPDGVAPLAYNRHGTGILERNVNDRVQRYYGAQAEQNPLPPHSK